MKYRKKPIIVEAVLWTGDVDNVEAPEWFKNNMKNGNIRRAGKALVINTMEGNMYCCVGDYVVQGVKAEVYPIHPDIFKLTYEKVEESEET